MCSIRVEANKTAAAAEALGVRALAIQADAAHPETNHYISTEVKNQNNKQGPQNQKHGCILHR